MSNHDLNGKIAIVTGGTRGLGRAIALGLARLGATVAMNYRRDEASAAKTLDEVRAIAPRSILVKADLEDEAQVRAMVTRAASELGGLDILVANAAATAFKPLLETKPHNLARTFALSVNGFVAAVQEASHVMSDGGRVLMISGIDSIRNLPGHGVLGAAKAALESMVRDFAFELGPRGITVNGLNVGYIDTDSARFYANYLGDNYEDFQRRCAERSALKRLPTLDEIAAIRLPDLPASRQLPDRANNNGRRRLHPKFPRREVICHPNVFPLPARERMKVRVLIQRALFPRAIQDSPSASARCASRPGELQARRRTGRSSRSRSAHAASDPSNDPDT